MDKYDCLLQEGRALKDVAQKSKLCEYESA